MRTRTQFAIAALVAASISLAQERPPAEMVGMMKDFYIPVLVRNDVAIELNLTESQRNRIKTTFESDLKGGGGKRPWFMPASMMRGMIRKKMGEIETKCLEPLDTAQRARLKQLWYQWLGPVAVYRDDVKSFLKITPDQRRTIDRIKSQKSEEQKRTSPSPLIIDGEEQALIAKVLTPGQRESLASLGGKAITFDPKHRAYVQVPGN